MGNLHANTLIVTILQPPKPHTHTATNTMTNRKNLKIAPDTYEELCEEKRDMETWDSFQRRMLRAVRSANE